MLEILEHFNTTFKGQAKAKIKGDELQITIGTVMMQIQLPSFNGAQSVGAVKDWKKHPTHMIGG